MEAVGDIHKHPVHLVLLGDSVLDNFYWLSDHQQDVRQQLQTELRNKNPNHKVSNWAVDESTIGSVYYGKRPRDVYVTSRSWNALEPYPTATDGKVYPLRLLEEGKVTHAALSIGGNDARAAFAQSFDLENIYAIMVQCGIVENFEKLVVRIIKHVPKLILVYIYHPQITMVPLIWGLPPSYVVKELLIKFATLFMKQHRLNPLFVSHHIALKIFHIPSCTFHRPTMIKIPTEFDLQFPKKF